MKKPPKKQRENDDEFIPNEGHYHEVMDRSSMMLEIWEEQIKDLAVTKYDPRLRSAAEIVSIVMSHFYQVAGEVHSENEENAIQRK